MHHYSPADIVTYILSRDDQELSKLTSERIVGLFDCDPPVLLDQFEAYQHISLADYLSRERVYRAANQLRKHKVRSLQKLSGSLGFKDSNAFSLEFKRIFCIEPERYFYLMEVKRFRHQFFNCQ